MMLAQKLLSVIGKGGSDSLMYAINTNISGPSGVQFNSSGNVVTVTQLDDLVEVSPTPALGYKRRLTFGSGVTLEGLDIASDGSVYVATINGTGTNKSGLVKYNSAGTLQWQREISGATFVRATDLCVDSAGNAIIVGSTGVGSGGGFVAKYNSSGTLQWQRSITPASNYIRIEACAVDGSDNVIIGGTYYTGTLDTGVVMKYSSSGALQWQKSYSNGGTTATVLNGIASDSSGASYLVGTLTVSGLAYGSITKIDSAGAHQWTKRLPSSGTTFNAVALDATERPIAVGQISTTALITLFTAAGTETMKRGLRQVTSNQVAAKHIAINSTKMVVASSYSADSKAIYTVVPLNGDGQGTYGSTFIYEDRTDTYTSVTPTFSTSTYTDAAGGFTDAAGTLTDSLATVTLTNYTL